MRNESLEFYKSGAFVDGDVLRTIAVCVSFNYKSSQTPYRVAIWLTDDDEKLVRFYHNYGEMYTSIDKMSEEVKGTVVDRTGIIAFLKEWIIESEKCLEYVATLFLESIAEKSIKTKELDVREKTKE